MKLVQKTGFQERMNVKSHRKSNKVKGYAIQT